MLQALYIIWAIWKSLCAAPICQLLAAVCTPKVQQQGQCLIVLSSTQPNQPQVRPVAEDEMFRVLKSGKRKKKSWKRMVTKVTFVGQGFTRKPPKYERFIRPSGE